MTDQYFMDNYLDFCLFTIAAMSADFIDSNIDWIYQEGGVCSDLLKNLFERREQPKQAAKIIERWYNIYVI
jgi:hypothetical protein